MTKITKTLLVLSAVNLAAGLVFASDLVDVHNASAFYFTLPAGAIFLGLGLISKMLEKEIARYDAEQRNILIAASQPASEQLPADASAGHPRFAKAH